MVAAGSSYGTGICDLVSEECGPDTSDQVAWLTIPASEDGGANVGVKLEPDVDGDDALGSVVDTQVRHRVRAGRLRLVLQLRYDSTLLEKRDGNLRTWRDLEVDAPAERGGSYHRVVPCTKARAIPLDEVACVDRRKDRAAHVRSAGTPSWSCSPPRRAAGGFPDLRPSVVEV